ncbi:MAG: hypothetical protein V4619_00225 [Bacteroidota bacterium]
MKNKKFTYVLGVLVLCVWGIILYRVMGTLNMDKDDKFKVSERVVKEQYNDYELTKDTSKLKLNYRDPFGMVPFKDTTQKVTQRPLIINKVASVKQPVNWSFIKYSGYIRSQGSKKLIAVVIVNGKTVMLAEGETAEQVKLEKNLQDSIKVTFNHKSTFIKML